MVTERLIGDLTIMPPREIAYRGVMLKEMDPGAVWPSSMYLDTTHERWGILLCTPRATVAGLAPLHLV
jgi:hypothetical protein